MTDNIAAAKQRLQEGVPYLRYSIDQAKAEGGLVQLAVISKNPDGSGKIFAEFECLDFMNDICTVAEIPAQTEKQNLRARAAEFLHTHGLSVNKE